jgi:hypothetical protein
LKFAECLPIELADRVIQERLGDTKSMAETLARSTRVVIGDLPAGTPSPLALLDNDGSRV